MREVEKQKGRRIHAPHLSEFCFLEFNEGVYQRVDFRQMFILWR